MKKLWFPLVAAVVLAGCSPDRTVDTLVPRNSMAVVLIDHPEAVAYALGSGGPDLPWGALDGAKPWAAAAVPANPPGFLLALALGNHSADWATVQTWAHDRGGLEAFRFGSYAVLTSPGLPAPAVLDADHRFDLSRVRASGDPLAVYIDAQNALSGTPLPKPLQPVSAVLPWIEKNLSGLRIGFSAREGGLEVRLATDWKAAAPVLEVTNAWKTPADLSLWTGLLPTNQGVGLALSVPASALLQAVPLADPVLAKRWAALAPLLGPRVAMAASPRADGTWAWSAAVEAQDPQAVRQALKTLIAGGDLQRHFSEWAMDVDTPLIYQDKPDGVGGVRTQITLGAATVHLNYGTDRIAVTGGADALENAAVWKGRNGTSAPWFREAPHESSLVAAGSIDGLGGRGAVKVLADGNVEMRFWVDAAGLKSWEERLPQAALSWLSGPGGWTRAEP